MWNLFSSPNLGTHDLRQSGCSRDVCSRYRAENGEDLDREKLFRRANGVFIFPPRDLHCLLAGILRPFPPSRSRTSRILSDRAELTENDRTFGRGFSWRQCQTLVAQSPSLVGNCDPALFAAPWQWQGELRSQGAARIQFLTAIASSI